MSDVVVRGNRSRVVISEFLAETINRLGLLAARAAWVEGDGMHFEPWQVSPRAAPVLRDALGASSQPVVRSAEVKRYELPTVLAPQELACSTQYAPILHREGIDSVIVLDIAGTLDFEVRFVFVPHPGVTITPEMRASVHAAVQLIPTVIRQEGERGELSRGSHRDSLTGLLNRLGLEDFAREEVGDDEGDRAVVFVDLDQFKAINDTYGHAVGDEVLAGSGTRLRASIRPTDVVGRLGGDEFVMIARRVADTDAAVVVAQRLISAVARDHVLDSGDVISISASAGVALWRPGRSYAEALRDADELMYLAKRVGGGIAAHDGHGRTFVADGVVGSEREILDIARAPVEVRAVKETATGGPWGAHAILRGELSPLDAARIAHIVREQVETSGLIWSGLGHLVLEPRGRVWSVDDHLLDVLEALTAGGGPRCYVMVDGQPASAELRLVAREARARDLADLALAGVGASAADVRLLATLEPEVVVLDGELLPTLSAASAPGRTLEMVSAMARVISARVAVLGSPAALDPSKLARWGCGLVAELVPSPRKGHPS